MSKLIKGMINELLVNKGKGIDDVILSNIDTVTTFDQRILQANCLTSLFMLDVNKNPRDGFIRYCDDQEGYSNKKSVRVASILADAQAFKNNFDSKDFENRNAKKSSIVKFIDAIESDQAGFKEKYGNALFVKSLKEVARQVPDAHFAVQLLSALTRAKIKAKENDDFEKINEIENDCKPFVYLALKGSNPFKKQKDIQNAVLNTFKDEKRYEAAEYFRCLSINNIIKTKLASENQLNTNVEETNASNSLFYIGLDGFQLHLINSKDPNIKTKTLHSDNFTVQTDEKITDIVKNCALINDELQPTHNSKYIQKALMMINDKVNEFNGQTQKIKKSIHNKENFLQSAIVFLILLDVEEVKDDYDPIGIALANPISDILSMMKGSKQLDSLIMNSYRIANKITRAELGQTIYDRYFKQLPGVETNKETTTEEHNTTEVLTKKARGTVGTSVVKKPTNQVKANVLFYKKITKSLVAVLSKKQAELKKLEEKQQAYDEAKAAKQKAKKLSKAQAEKLAELQSRYGSADALSSMIDELKAMNSDMDFLADTMIKSIKKGEELSLDKVKQSMFLSEEQYQKNAERIESYTEYFEFIKAFDNARRVQMADIYAYRDSHKGTALYKLLIHLPEQRAKQLVRAIAETEDEKTAEEHVEVGESHN